MVALVRPQQIEHLGAANAAYLKSLVHVGGQLKASHLVVLACQYFGGVELGQFLAQGANLKRVVVDRIKYLADGECFVLGELNVACDVSEEGR